MGRVKASTLQTLGFTPRKAPSPRTRSVERDDPHLTVGRNRKGPYIFMAGVETEVEECYKEETRPDTDLKGKNILVVSST